MNYLLMKYFVLKPSGDDVFAKASRAAMRAYADIILHENKTFAKELREWADCEGAAAQERNFPTMEDEDIDPRDVEALSMGLGNLNTWLKDDE